LVTRFQTSGRLGGCGSGAPEGVLILAMRTPPDIVPGIRDRYATAQVNAGYALGTVIAHQMGRPINVEWYPEHPSSLGATDVFAQSEVLDFYAHDRAMAIMSGGVPPDRQSLLTAITVSRATIGSAKGKGFRILTDTVTSPTLARQPIPRRSGTSGNRSTVIMFCEARCSLTGDRRDPASLHSIATCSIRHPDGFVTASTSC
jgi:hypothetical protein